MKCKLNSPWKLFLSPKYFLFLPLFLFLRFCVFFPHRLQYAIGKALGGFLFYLDRKGKHTAKINLSLCFPKLSEQERAALLKKNYQEIGMSILETGIAWFAKDSQLPPYQITGLEHWKKLHEDGQGVLLVSAHFSCLEIVGRLVQKHIPLSVVYRTQKFKLLDAFAKYYREKIYTQTIDRHDFRTLIRGLKQGANVWYTPDVDGGPKNSVFAPFFGVEAATLTMTSRVTELGKASTLGIFFYHYANGYEIIITPPFENYPSEDAFKDARFINQEIEKAITKKPDQYLWQYKRFKTRPAGQPRFYSGKTHV